MTRSRWRCHLVLGIAVGAILTGCDRPAAADQKSEKDKSRPSSSETGSVAPRENGRPSTSAAEGKQGEAEGSESGGGATPATVTFNASQVSHGGVRWSPVVLSKSSATAIVPGQIVPNEDRTARLGAPAQGRVIAVRVRPGDRVSRGDVLVTMQSAEAGMAQADVTKAEAELVSKKAQAVYAASARARAERLLALKAIPQQDYERAIADDEQARASLTQAQSEVRRARSTASVLDANTSVSASGEIALRSPLTGVVLARTAVPGTVVEAGAPLVVVTDPSSLWVAIAAPETMAGLFTRGGRLRLTVPAYPADTFAARVEAVGAGLDPETRTLSVRAVTSDAKGKLKAEMLASVEVEGGRSLLAAVIPEDAVQLVAGVPTVFVVETDAKGGARFSRRNVELGARGNGQVAVINGLRSGDLVVTQGAFAVKAEFQKGSMPKMEM
jgi:membrane fusion protein, heavy metal efflux system